MIPKYTIKHPLCYDNIGSIIIDNIIMSKEEKQIYGNHYKIIWSSNIDINNISKSQKRAFNLKAGNYSFKIIGNNTESELFNIQLLDYPPLLLSNIKIDFDYISPAKIHFNIDGGLPPYTIKYDKYTIDNYFDSSIILPEINTNTNDFILVIDSNGCEASSSEPIKIIFPEMKYKIISNDGPSFYDNHANAFIIRVTDTVNNQHSFQIYQSENNTKQQLIDTINYDQIEPSNIIHSHNGIEYNLSKFIYPGTYIIDIQNEYNCILSTEEISIKNTEPLAISVSCKNNYCTTAYQYNNTIFIYDTLLIPYILLLQDNNILSWIKELNNHQTVDIFIDNIRYPLSFPRICEYDYIVDNTIKILQLDQDPSQWFIKINIAKGFSLSDYPNIAIANINISINNKKYPVGLDITDHESIRLIRTNLITTSLNSIELIDAEAANIAINKNNQIDTIYSGPISDYSFNYVYNIGNCTLIDIISKTNNQSIIDLNHPNFLIENIIFTNEQCKEMKNIKNYLYNINDINNKIIIQKKSLSYFGNITLRPKNKLSIIPHTIEYLKYDPISKNTYSIKSNESNIPQHCILDLSDGIYIIKIHTETNEKIKRLNQSSYDQHYEASLKYITDTLGLSINDIPFTYGDIFIILFSDSSMLDNIPGLSYNTSNTESYAIQRVRRTKPQPMISNYQLEIFPDHDILFHVSGPNNFKFTGQGKTRLNNLETGLYTITGDTNSLEQHSLQNVTKYVFIDNSKPKNIILKFMSYKNSNIFELQT